MGATSRASGANQAHGSPANILDLYGASDMPETEGTEIQRFKWATSAAHVAGRRLVSAEAATWLGEHFRVRLAEVKTTVDQFFVAGVNHIDGDLDLAASGAGRADLTPVQFTE